jgi:hypothetical protein
LHQLYCYDAPFLAKDRRDLEAMRQEQLRLYTCVDGIGAELVADDGEADGGAVNGGWDANQQLILKLGSRWRW